MKSTLSKPLVLFCLLFIFACKNQTVEIKEQDVSPIVSMQKQAYFYYNMKRYAKSIEVYKKIIALGQTDPDKYDEDLAWAYYETGFCFLVENKFKEALPFFKKVLDTYDAYPDIHTLSKDRIEEINVRSRGRVNLSNLNQTSQIDEVPEDASPPEKD